MITKENLERLGKGTLASYAIIVAVCIMVWLGTPETLPTWVFVTLLVILPLLWFMGFVVEMLEDIGKF